MLSNGQSKVKYPSFRIDDILNSDFGNRTLQQFRTNHDDGLRTDFESNGDQLKASSEDEAEQPINLSSVEYPKKSENLLNLSFSLPTNECFTESQFTESQFKNLNLKSISSISSSSPTLSVGSSDSPSFQSQLSPTSKSPTIDQLIKCNHGALNDPSGGALKSHFPANLLGLCSEETDQCYPSGLSDASSPFFIGQQYPRSAIEEFYLKLSKKPLDHSEPNKFEPTNFDKPIDSLTEELSLHNISDALKKFQQDYQAQQLAKSSLLNQLPSYPATLSSNFSSASPALNQPNSSFYMQQFYIRMKMAMQSKPRKGGQIRFNHQQTNELETMFNVKRYLMPSERRQIAKKLSLSERQVKTWFQNRRAKQRRSKF